MRKFLLATTAAAVVLGAQGLAHAQTNKPESDGARTQVAPSATKPSTSSNSINGTTTTGQSTVNTSSGAGATSAQTSLPSNAAGGTTNPSAAGAASQAQTTPATQPSANQTQQTGTGSNTTSRQNQPATNAPTTAQQQPPSSSNVNTAQQPAGNTSAHMAQRNGTDVNASVNINEQQRTRISQSFARLDVRPLNNVNFQISVGTSVPRDVRLEPVPTEVVEIVPQYRGYSFFAVRDEIVIVEPSSSKIVAVLPRSGNGNASTTTTRKTTFSDADRAAMRKHVHARTQSAVTTGSSARTKVIVGEPVPDSVEMRSFPEEVYRESPRLKEYRYIEEGDRAYVVEPRERRIIEEIE